MPTLSSLSRSRVRWPILTRRGEPEFVVIRFPLKLGSGEVAVGDRVPKEQIANRTRLRQLYEQRYIDPVIDEATGRPFVLDANILKTPKIETGALVTDDFLADSPATQVAEIAEIPEISDAPQPAVKSYTPSRSRESSRKPTPRSRR